MNYDLETLCTCYSLECLKLIRQKRLDGVKPPDKPGPWVLDGVPGVWLSNDVVWACSMQLLEKAIQCYNNEEFQLIRDGKKPIMSSFES